MNSQWKTKIKAYAGKSVPKFKFEAKFGSKGTGNGWFDGPYFVANDKQGNIYVSDFDNHRIQIFDSNGQWLKSIRSKWVWKWSIQLSSRNCIQLQKSHVCC